MTIKSIMDWIEKDGKLIKEFELDSFSAITNVLPKIAKIADEMDHHPDFEVYAYKKIRFTLFTHSENKITELDYQLAEEIDGVLKG